MPTLTINLRPTTFERLRQRADEAGTSPEALSGELLEAALGAGLPPTPEALDEGGGDFAHASGHKPAATPRKSTREILREAGHLTELSPYLRSLIIPGVTLEEVHAIMAKGGGPPLSEIIIEQRGPKD